MGNSQDHQITYSLPQSQLNPDAQETPIYRHPKFQGNLLTTYDKEIHTLQDVLLKSAVNFGGCPHLGTREKDKDGNLGQYQFKTFKECFEFARIFGGGLIQLGLVPFVNEYLNYKLKMIGIFSQNREEWYLLAQAAAFYGFTIVPFYATLGIENISYVLEHTNLRTMCMTVDKIDIIAKFKQNNQSGKLQNIILLGKTTDEQLNTLKDVGFNAFQMNQVLIEGSKKAHYKAKIDKDDIYTFCYTSGTTGTPKGALLSHGAILANIAAAKHLVPLTENETYISYLPLPHVYEHLGYWLMISYGIKVGIYSGDVKKLKFDMQVLQPTIFPSVPRLLNKVFDSLQMKIDEQTGFKAWVAKKGIKSKLKKYKKKGKVNSWLYDSLVFNKMRSALGGKVKHMTSGSAPINPNTLDFLRIAFSAKIQEGYGQTESCGLSTVTDVNDTTSGHVGGISPAQELKLVDIPEMSYHAVDKDKDGNSMPRGEICLRGPGIFKGYYKNMKKTAETLDNDGWLHTGDVGVILKNGALKIIDRKKNIFKLAQGEYVAPEKIENIYIKIPIISELFVHGDSLQSFLVGIIVPEKDILLQLAEELGLDNVEYLELCQNQKVIDKILKIMNDTAKEAKLWGFEKVRKLYICPQSFDESNLLTTTFKLKRNVAKDHFQGIINQMYGIEQEEEEEKQM